jgi:hypothetical protein
VLRMGITVSSALYRHTQNVLRTSMVGHRRTGPALSGKSCLTQDRVDDFPILIKMNSTDYLKGGIDFDNFPEMATAI